jgi:hypothetical protein
MNAITEISVTDLQAMLAEAEESAIRALRIRDETCRENDQLKMALNGELKQSHEWQQLLRQVATVKNNERLAQIERDNLKMEVKLLKAQAKLLKQALKSKQDREAAQ